MKDKELEQGELLCKFEEKLRTAQKVKHPDFAEGIYEALGFLGEEYGEVVKAITKGEGRERVESELLDLMVVAFRMLLREYDHGE